LRKVLAGGGVCPDCSRCHQGSKGQGDVAVNDSIDMKPNGKR
jgi:hypothetical protein